MNPLVPLIVLLSLPVAAIALVLGTDAGVDSALIGATVKTFIILGILAVGLSVGAAKLAERAK